MLKANSDVVYKIGNVDIIVLLLKQENLCQPLYEIQGLLPNPFRLESLHTIQLKKTPNEDYLEQLLEAYLFAFHKGIALKASAFSIPIQLTYPDLFEFKILTPFEVAQAIYMCIYSFCWGYDDIGTIYLKCSTRKDFDTLVAAFEVPFYKYHKKKHLLATAPIYNLDKNRLLAHMEPLCEVKDTDPSYCMAFQIDTLMNHVALLQRKEVVKLVIHILKEKGLFTKVHRNFIYCSNKGQFAKIPIRPFM